MPLPCPGKARGSPPKWEEVPTQQGQLCHHRQLCSWFTRPACPGPTASVPVPGRRRWHCPGRNRDGTWLRGVVSSFPSLSPTPFAPEPIPTYTQPPALTPAKTATLERKGEEKKKKKAAISVGGALESWGQSRAPWHCVLHCVLHFPQRLSCASTSPGHPSLGTSLPGHCWPRENAALPFLGEPAAYGGRQLGAGGGVVCVTLPHPLQRAAPPRWGTSTVCGEVWAGLICKRTSRCFHPGCISPGCRSPSARPGEGEQSSMRPPAPSPACPTRTPALPLHTYHLKAAISFGVRGLANFPDFGF